MCDEVWVVWGIGDEVGWYRLVASLWLEVALYALGHMGDGFALWGRGKTPQDASPPH